MSHVFILKIIRALLYTLLTAVPLVFWKFSMYPFQVVKTTLFESLVEIIFALWVGLAFSSPRFRPKRTPLLLTLTIFFGVMVASAFLGIDPARSFWSTEARTLGLVSLLHFGALFLVMTSLRDEIDWEKIFRASLAVSSLTAAGAIVQRYALPTLFLESDVLRPGATFGNPTFLSGYLLFHIFLGLWLFFEAGRREKKIRRLHALILFGILLDIFAVFLTQTVGALLGLGAGAVILLIYFAFLSGPLKDEGGFLSGRFLKKLALTLFIFFVIFSSVFLLTRDSGVWKTIPGLRRLSEIEAASYQVQFRLIGWRNAWYGFLEKPFLGWGWENFNVAFSKRYDPRLLTVNFSETYWDKPHNVFLEYLVTGGSLGLLAYLTVLVALFSQIFKIYKRPLPSHPAPFLMAMFVAYLVQNTVVFDTIGTYLMFFVTAAFVDSKYREVRNEGEARNLSKGSSPHRIPPLFLGIPFLPALILVYFNIQTFRAARFEWQGVNYFLNRLFETSLLSFNKALATPTPYRDDIRKNFAGTVKQAYEQDLAYPNLEALVPRLVGELEAVIKNEPLDYFNYTVLADFKNTFFQFDPTYLKEAEELAEKALALSPNRQQVYYVIAKTKILEKDYPAAFAAFQEAVNANPEAGDPHFYYGILSYQVGDAKKGDEEIARAKALGREPREIPELIALGNFAADLKGDYALAIDYFTRAIAWGQARNVETKDAEIKLAISYYFNAQFEEAKEVLEALGRKIDFRTLRVYNDLKPILEQLGVRY